MSESPYSLMPDDGPEPLTLEDTRPVVAQPYGLTALLVGALALLVLQAFWHDRPLALALSMSLFLATGVYLGFIVLQPRLPLIQLALLASMVGMLYSLPMGAVFIEPWQSLPTFLTLLVQLILAGMIGMLISRRLGVDIFPKHVLVICFLATFDLVGLWYLIMPVW